MREIKISPSILAADFSKLGEEVVKLEKAGADYIHIDIMDGNFVPNISFGSMMIQALRKKTNLIFDVHLMIKEPERYLNEIIEAGADIVTFHYEGNFHIHRLIKQVKDKNKKVAVAINPATSIESLKYILNDLDMVLIMSVNPGFGGQKFIFSVLEKIKDLRKLNSNIDIEVDGGINEENIRLCIEAGANIIVAGSYIFKGNYSEQIRKLKKKIKKEN